MPESAFNHAGQKNPWLLWKFRLLYHQFQLKAIKASLWFYILLTICLFFSSWWVMSRFEPENVPDFGTFFYWFVTTISTVGYGDISPQSPQGRAITMALMLLGIGLFSVIAGTLITFIVNLKTRILKGLLPIVKENHILILGYHPVRTQRMLEEIHGDRYRSNRPVVLLADIEENPFGKQADFVRCDVAQEESLEKASADKASCIVIYGKDDNETLAASICANKLASPDCHIVAYVGDPKRASHVKGVASRITVIVSTAVEAMVQEIQDPGTSGLISDLLSNTRSQTCYRLRVGNYQGDYGEIAHLLKRQHEIQPIGLWSASDQEVIENPPFKTPIEPGSLLYVIAESRPRDIPWESLQTA